MESIKYFNKWSAILFVSIIALVLAHLDIIEKGILLTEQYQFPFSSFIINSFYTGIALFLFHVVVEKLD